MSVLKIQFNSDAKAEYYKSVRFYKEIDKQLSEDFYTEMEEALQKIKEFPEAGHPYLHKTRRVFLDRFPYSIIYKLIDDQIIVFAIHHMKRRPGYWTKRIK